MRNIFKIYVLFAFSLSLSLYGNVKSEISADIVLDQKKLELITKKIAVIKNNIITNTKNSKMLERYYAASNDWRELYNIQAKGIFLEVDKTIEFSDITIKREVERLQELRQSLLIEIEKIFILASRQRSLIIKELSLENKLFQIKLNEVFFFNLALEIRSIPLRWISLFKARSQKIEEDLQLGVSGWGKVLKELSKILVIFLLGFVFSKFFKRVSLYLNSIRDKHTKKSYRSRKSRNISTWLSRVSPLLSWIWLVVFLDISESLIAGSYFKELSILFPYFTYYAYYRIFRLFIKQILLSYSFYKYDINFRIDKQKLDWTTRFLGRTFLVVLIVLHTFKSAGGEGFLYFISSSLSKYFLIFIVFYMAYKWSLEIKMVAQRTFSGVLLNAINKGFQGKLKPLICLPILILELIFQSVFRLYSFLEEFDLVRAISAQYFRKKVEISKTKKEEEEKRKLPLDYIEKFQALADSNFKLEKGQQGIFDTVSKNIKLWNIDECDERITLIHGEKGIGKSFLMTKIKESLEESTWIDYKISERYSQGEQLQQMNLELKARTEKTIVFIDDLERFFISKRGGFKNFQDFLKLTQEDSLNHVFWCLCINNYSWEFLESVLNKNRYFNSILKIDRWREEDIQSSLLKKNANTGYLIDYDKVLFDNGKTIVDGDTEDIEARYFRILWEEALGNPSVAQDIWLSSVFFMKEGLVKALIPQESSNSIMGLPDDFYFILATIVRHESLSIREILESTDLSEDIVRNAVKKCLETGYLIRTSQLKVRIAPLFQHAVYSTLKRMNFIYG